MLLSTRVDLMSLRGPDLRRVLCRDEGQGRFATQRIDSASAIVSFARNKDRIGVGVDGMDIRRSAVTTPRRPGPGPLDSPTQSAVLPPAPDGQGEFGATEAV